MKIAANTVVSLDVQLSDLWGTLIEQSDEPVQYLHGGYGDIFPAVEAMLDGRSGRDFIEVRLEPEEAFGDYNEQLLRVESRSKYPDTLEVGMRFEGEVGTADEGIFFAVTDIADDKVVLEGNHPLAGLALKFACTVVEVRPASSQEIANGSADDIGSLVFRALP